MTEKPLNHQVNIVRVPEPRVHTNADSLELFDIGGYQVVAKKSNFKAGDLAVYIQPDSVVPQTEPFKWLWEAYIGLDGIVPTRRRRITVRKFRGEWSEGLLMPVADFGWRQDVFGDKPCVYFANSVSGTTYIPEGSDVSTLLGITHYEPEEDSPEGSANAPVRKARRPKTLKGWLRFFWYRLLHLTHIKSNDYLAKDSK
jgi:RNA ligase (TIGR02306 family)